VATYPQSEARTSLLILAGGRGTRLGGARKAFLEVGGRPILARVVDALAPLVDECLALVHDADMPVLEGVNVLVDPAPHAGVLPALLHGLRSASGEVCMIVAGDMPFVQRAAFEYLLRLLGEEGVSAVIPRVDGFLQPMHCVVRRHVVIDSIEVGLAAGEHRLFRVLAPLKPRLVDEAELRLVDPDLLTLFNVNTPEDVATAERIAYRTVR
jgi:molybdopterin-guanine dinucleotide biosynthesis protein A